MVALVGGLVALLLGIIGIFAWWDEFLWLLKGVIPPILILGGVLATYLGAEEMKDKRRAESEAAMEPFAPAAGGDDADRYKQEVAELKAKLAAMEESAPSAEEKAEDKPEEQAEEKKED